VTLEVIFCPDGVTQKTSFGRLPMSWGQCSVAKEPTNTETGESLFPAYKHVYSPLRQKKSKEKKQ